MKERVGDEKLIMIIISVTVSGINMLQPCSRRRRVDFGRVLHGR